MAQTGNYHMAATELILPGYYLYYRMREESDTATLVPVRPKPMVEGGRVLARMEGNRCYDK